MRSYIYYILKSYRYGSLDPGPWPCPAWSVEKEMQHATCEMVRFAVGPYIL